MRDAHSAGLDVVALTNHDSTLGWEAAARQARDLGLIFVPGCEISAKYHGISVHILAYLHDPTHERIRAHETRVVTARRDRARLMVERLAEDFPITWDMVLDQTQPGTTVGRPHIADALVAVGVVPHRSAAFDTLLTPSSPNYVHHYAPDVIEAVEMIAQAGGVSVFAHPGASARGEVVGDHTINGMIDAGLDGLEIHHRDNPPHQRERLTEIARRRGLLITGSSDYHGDGKPNRLGENTTTQTVFAQIEERGMGAVVRP